jgi:hypothetical protein
MHSNKAVFRIAEAEIHDQILRLPRHFTSADFLTALAANAPREYEAIVRIYTTRGYDRPHAESLESDLRRRTPREARAEWRRRHPKNKS